MWRVTRKAIWAHKLRLVMTSVAVVVGVAFVSGSLVLSSVLNTMFDGLFTNVYKNIDVVARGEEPEFGGERPKLDASLVDAVTRLEGVAKVEGWFGGPAQLIGKNGRPVGGNGPPSIATPWTSDPDFNPYRITEGRPPATAGELVVDAGTAKRGEVDVGETVRITTAEGVTEMTLVGIAKFGELDNAGGSNFLFLEHGQARSLVGVEGKVDGINVVVGDGVAAERVRDRIAALMPAETEVLTGEQAADQDAKVLQEGLAFIGTVPLVFAGIALFVGAFIINNIFSILVAQRSKEMALLRAIGASRRQVLLSVIAEALVVGLVASVLGLFAGLGVAKLLIFGLGMLGTDFPETGLALEASTVVVALVAGVGVTVVSAFLPSRRASRIPPIAALRDVALERSGISVGRLAVGFLLSAAGGGLLALGLFGDVDRAFIPVGAGAALMFVGVYVLGPLFARPVAGVIGLPLRLFGVAGALARENAMRNPRRTSSTAAALMIGVTLVTLAGVFTASAKASIAKTIDESFGGDFVVAGPQGFGGVGLPVTLAAQVEALPEVEAVVPLSSFMAEASDEITPVSALDAGRLEGVLDVPTTSGAMDDVRDGAFAVHTTVARNRGWQLGEEIQFQFPGGRAQTLRLAAVYEDASLLGPYVIDRATYLSNVAVPVDALIMVKKSSPATPDATRAALESLAASYPQASVQDQTDIKASASQAIDGVFVVLLVLLGLSIVIALLGIATTLALSVFERTRELGLLRAVGMSRRQMRRMVRWESVVVAVFGAMLGLAIGLLFGVALVMALRSEGIDQLAIPAVRLGIVVLVAIAAGVVAAIFPARRAARLDILKAIATE